ncbi:MAG: hypothetical protein ABJC09_01460 [Terriglobia bacterium]
MTFEAEPPAGTFMAKARGGAIHFPPAIKAFCTASGWTLFRVTRMTDDRLDLDPVLPGDDSEIDESGANEEFHSSLPPDGVLWIPGALRAQVSLGEQSVMMRIEGGVIAVYLRKVFETLGFGP